MAVQIKPETKPQAKAPNAERAAVEDLVRRGREAMLLYDAEGYEVAVPLFREAIELSPAHAPAYAGLAETYSYWGFRREINGQEAQSLYDMAYEYADVALRLAPERAECHRAMAVALRRGKKSDPERRKQEILIAMDLNPEDPETLCEHWRAFGYEPDHPSVKRALELNPRLCGVRIDLGAVYCEMERFEDAIESLTQAVRINPRNTLAYYDLAMALDRAGQRPKARELLRKVSAAFPDDPLIETGLEVVGR